MPKELTSERLRELLHYEPSTGSFTWRKAWPRMPVGSLAGHRTGLGYWRIKVEGGNYLAHRLAWLYMTGHWPPGDIDHIDTDSLNNRWENLRSVTEHENLQNQRRAHRNNKVGVLGVSKFSWGCVSRIRVNGRDVRLGTFATVEEAHQAYLAAKRLHHPGNTL